MSWQKGARGFARDQESDQRRGHILLRGRAVRVRWSRPASAEKLRIGIGIPSRAVADGEETNGDEQLMLDDTDWTKDAPASVRKHGCGPTHSART